MKGTKTQLVTDLKAIVGATPSGEQRNRLWRIIANAEDGVYHDFESDLAAPKVQLVFDLMSIKTDETEAIATRIKNGDYEDDPFDKGEEPAETVPVDPPVVVEFDGKTEEITEVPKEEPVETVDVVKASYALINDDGVQRCAWCRQATSEIEDLDAHLTAHTVNNES